MDNFGFPKDDELSMMQGDNGTCNLDIFYSCQFVQNETTNHDHGLEAKTVYAPLEHTPIIPGTTVGSVYAGTGLVCTFTVDSFGSFNFTDVGHPNTKPIFGEIDLKTGQIQLNWNGAPGPNHLVVSYEYNMDCTNRKPASQINPLSLRHVTFESFFVHSEIEKLLNGAGTVSCWDFNTCLGETIREKYESLFVKVCEITNVLIKKGAAGYFWVVCSPEVSSIFETATYGFYPISSDEYKEMYGPGGQIPMGSWTNTLQYKGLIHQKWRLYTDPMLDSNRVLIGVNDKEEKPEHYARLSIANFII